MGEFIEISLAKKNHPFPNSYRPEDKMRSNGTMHAPIPFELLPPLNNFGLGDENTRSRDKSFLSAAEIQVSDPNPQVVKGGRGRQRQRG